MRQLLISTLGALTFSFDGQPLDNFDYAKVRALLLLLAVRPGQPQTRAALCAMLWPDATERSARTNLSQALTRLRKAIPVAGDEPLLLANTDAVQINPACNVEIALDVVRFEHLLDDAETHAHRAWKTCAKCAERLTDAVALYRGNFLHDFSLPDSAPFEEWAQAMRESLRQRAITAHERLARRAEWCGDWAGAIRHVQRQIELDPLNEACHRDLMRLLAINQQVPAAHQQYDVLRHRLDAELGVPPADATQQLYAHIAAGEIDELPRDVAPPSRLPVSPTDLIGRDDDAQRILHLFREDGARLMTLTGPGGVGKTRLALHVADVARYDYRDGVYCVDLTPLNDPALVSATIADAFGLPEKSPDALRRHASRLHTLLMLDNFEHVAEAAPFLASLLADCPGLTLLITSRVALRIRAERVVPIGPLAVPDVGASVDEVRHTPAVQLFVERAHAIQPAFSLTPENAGDVGAISRRLDGLPLALELVATKTDSFAPAEILQHLEPSLPMLTDGPRDLPARQRTMRDAIRWSVELLDPSAWVVFANIGVFAGGFTAEAMEAVCESGCDIAHALRVMRHANLIRVVRHDGSHQVYWVGYRELSKLRGIHAVRHDGSHEVQSSNAMASSSTRTRYVALETVREFAQTELALLERLEPARSRHAAYFAELAAAAKPHLTSPQLGQWLERLECELDNIRAAVRWCMAHDVGAGLGMVSDLERFWIARGNLREARTWLEELLAQTDDTVTPKQIADATVSLGILCMRLQDYPASRMFLQKSLRLNTQRDDQHNIALALSKLGAVAGYQGDYAEAERYQRESIALSKRIGYDWNVAASLNNLAEVLRMTDRFHEACSCFAESTTRYRELGDLSSAAITISNRAAVVRVVGEYDEAQRLYEESYAVLAGLGDKTRMAHALFGMGNVARARGEVTIARQRYRESITLFYGVQHEGDTLMALRQLAQLEWAEGVWSAERIVELLSVTSLHLVCSDGKLDPEDQAEYDAMLVKARAALDPIAFDEAWARGQTLSLGELPTRVDWDVRAASNLNRRQ
jgi:predicted ATPase/DNA-binding SARP family transcriptional activator